MECITLDVERGHLGVSHLDALGIDVGVEFAADLEARLRGGRSNQFDHGQAAGQRPTAPVLRDVAEHAVLYLVPFRCAGRIVAHHKGQACGIGKFLKLDLPQPDAAAIGAAAIGRDHRKRCYYPTPSNFSFFSGGRFVVWRAGGLRPDRWHNACEEQRRQAQSYHRRLPLSYPFRPLEHRA